MHGGGPPAAYSRSSALARKMAILRATRSGDAFRVHVENVLSPGVRWRLPITSVAVTSWTNARSLLSVFRIFGLRATMSRVLLETVHRRRSYLPHREPWLLGQTIDGKRKKRRAGLLGFPTYHVVLAVQTLRAPLRVVLGESRYARVWTAVRDVIPETRAIPPQRISRTRL